MVRHRRISLHFLPALSFSVFAVSLAGCTHKAAQPEAQSASSSAVSLSAPAKSSAGSVLASAGKNAVEALFSEIGPPPFAALQNAPTSVVSAAPKRAVTLADLPKPVFSFKTVKTEGGPGVIVFEPESEAGTDPALADVAAGCSDWLFFTVGGQPSLGQTPLLTSVSRAQRELKRTQNLRLGLTDARHVAAVTGASHVVVGTLKPAGPGKGTLTYTLYAVNTGQAAGKPLIVSGDAEGIRRQLPRLASDLSRQLGVSATPLPAQIDATVSELAALGRVVWTESPQAADMKTISAASPRVALANLCQLTQERYASGTNFKRDSTLLLTRLAPENSLAWGHAAYMNPLLIAPHIARLAALRRQYPRNYALAHSDVWMNREAGDARTERRAAEDAVRAAPGNPDAWLSFGWTVSEEADKLRAGRRAANISREEWAFLHTVYPLWEHAVARATELDSQHELAWTRLAQAATFSGSKTVADDAFWKAETFSRDKSQVFDWGLQMFQQKWGGAKADLDRAAEDAAKADYQSTKDAAYIAKQLQTVGYDVQADTLLKRWSDRIESRLAQNPNDSSAHWDKAALLFAMEKKPAACREMEKVVKLLPQSVEAQYAYAETLLGLGADVRSIPEYRRVLELDPQNVDAALKLGSGLMHAKKWDESEKWYRVAVTRAPNSGEGHLMLAELLQFYSPKKRHAEAAQEFARCMALGGDAPGVYGGRVFALADSGRAKEAVRWGEEAMAKYDGRQYGQVTDKETVYTQVALAYAYMMDKRYKEAIEQGEAALQIAPDDPNPHEALGDAYNALGRRRDARNSWAIVTSRIPEENDPEGVGHARKMLAKYPENGT